MGMVRFKYRGHGLYYNSEEKTWGEHTGDYYPASDYEALEAEVKQLKSWKADVLYVESEWDCQAIGRLLGLRLGSNIRAKIQPAIEALQAEVKRLKIERR